MKGLFSVTLGFLAAAILSSPAHGSDGFKYLQEKSYSVYHAIETGVAGTRAFSNEPPCTSCQPEETQNSVLQAILGPLSPIRTDILSRDSGRTVVAALPTWLPVPAPGAIPMVIDADSFVDTWINTDPNTLGITRIILGKSNGNMTVHAFGSCEPIDCDWDTVTVPYTGNPFTAVYVPTYAIYTLTIQLLEDGTLLVHNSTVFTDGSGRPDIESDYTFHRQTICVDDDNTSGVEDGSQLYPYNTISEGIAAAISGQIVRVLPGRYAETVDMKDGVSVLGSGADSTVIDRGGSGFGVTCVGIGSGTLLSGFTITNANMGIYCQYSNLSLRENTIVNIDPSSFLADGIRLDNSSPLIQNNVIYHVGGIGIRGQGYSEPRIINNTIYDYRYYAGISFAALDVGAVSPVIKNNIVVRGNTEPVGGILWRSPASPVVSYNDVFDPANVADGDSYYAFHDGTAWSQVPGGIGALSEDPSFTDVARGDFHLVPGSPCVDAGDPDAAYNDLDGSRNDMGAFGGQRLDPGVATHSGSGFIFTGIGKVPITEIVSDPSDPSYGLLRVSDAVADDLSIQKFTDAALGGYLWLRGLFGADDDVDYYQVLVAPYGTSSSVALDDPLVKTQFTINSDATITRTQIQMGPQTVGGVPNVYLLNKEGYWTFTDLRLIWNTTGLNGKYTVTYKAFRLLGDGTLDEVILPPNDLDQFTIEINNRPVEFRIDNIAYADHTPISECEKIAFPHLGDASLIFTITAWHPDGFLKDFRLNCYWGNNRYGGQFVADQYAGSNDGMPPMWQGVLNYELPPLLPRNSGGEVMDWHTCPYGFYLSGSARITDGVDYLRWGSDNMYQSVVLTGEEPATPTPTPEPTPLFTPTPEPVTVQDWQIY
ncbi:MAG TPA: right-handed parallel beta-helix repeat-containing protein [bacterium]|nr:right-handed parallel beta-helix repeat-containing protein [bacterium]